MQSSELQAETNYAWAGAPRDPDPLLEKVRYIGPVRRGQARVRWLSGELSGLEEWTATRQLLCEWRDRKAWRRDHLATAALDADSDEQLDPVVEEAVSHVLTATGEEGGFSRRWMLQPAKAERLWRRAGLGSPLDEPLAFVDHHGDLHLGYRSALRFARAFAVAEPEVCLQTVRHYEEEMNAQGYLPGQEHRHDFLRRERPAFALVEHWCSTSRVSLLEAELKRVRGLVEEAERWLRAGNDGEHADQLVRALRRR